MKISGLTRDEDLAEITVGDVKQASAVIEALVDYVEAREWHGLGFEDGQVVFACTDCEVHKTDSNSGITEHRNGCRWFALMRAAGRR